MSSSSSLFTPVTALGLIRDARDYNAEHGTYPYGTLEEGQEFDDWAADLAQRVLDAEPANTLTITLSDAASDTMVAMLRNAVTYCVRINSNADYRLEAVGTDAIVVRNWPDSAGSEPDDRQPPFSIPLARITHVHIY